MKKLISLTFLLLVTAVHAQFDAIRTLQPDQGQEVRRPIEAVIFNSAPADLPAHETALLEIFQDSKTTLEGKQYACRMLRHCASKASIPILAPQLTNPDLSSFVRLVFQGLKSSAADKALLKALPKASPALQIGIVGTLGQRGNVKSIKAINPFLKSHDPKMQNAAIIALGNIGGKDAIKALAKTNTTQSKLVQIKCAKALKPKMATSVYTKYQDDDNVQVQVASLIGMTQLFPVQFTPEVLKVLDSESPKLRRAALGLLASCPTKNLLDGIGTLAPENQLFVITSLANRKATDAETIMLQLTKSKNEAVRDAALQALGSVGRDASVATLIAAAPTSKPAFASLTALQTSAADPAILQALEKSTDPVVQEKMIACLAQRQSHAALSAIVIRAEAPWSRTTKTAIDAVSALIRTDEFGIYVQLMNSAKEPEKYKALEKSAAQAAQRQLDTTACTQPLIVAFKTADKTAKQTLLRTLGRIGGQPARELLTQSLSDPNLKDAAIRGLCNWPDLEVADQLLEQAKTASEESQRVLALRGYIRLAGTTTDFAVVSNMCTQAAAVAEQPAELKSVISCMKRFRGQEVLDFLAPYLDNDDVFAEAAWSICEVSTHKKLHQSSIPLLQKIAEKTTDEALSAKVKELLKKYQPQPKKNGK